ncbi:very short patch repair endonuclease [Fluviicola taffensis]|uniref:very short patch repair endonuclease n=1 Tax=Fluviicola taffensis TaxID=191579 RepID=UPI00313815F9
MPDIHDKATRSYNMSRVRSKDTKPELMVRKFLFSNGLRFRLHDVKLPGKPDIILPKYKTVIFVNGCFWHGHEGCKLAVLPQTRTEFWKDKIEGNKKRDLENIEQLKNKEWNVLTIFGCELKKNTRDNTLVQILKTIQNHKTESFLK